MAFFRFPHTPHLVWLGADAPRDDKVLSPAAAAELLQGVVRIEEKIDGANLGLSFGSDGEMRLQSRGTLLARETSHPQFKPLFRWAEARRHGLSLALSDALILFGEWCYARHTIHYTRLPDWFLAFDVFDKAQQRFWSAPRRDELVHQIGLAAVPPIALGHFSLGDMERYLGISKVGDTPAEGIYIRQDEGPFLKARAKVVRPEFNQSIITHWSARNLGTNVLASGASW